jgi:hypothetical protein
LVLVDHRGLADAQEGPDGGAMAAGHPAIPVVAHETGRRDAELMGQVHDGRRRDLGPAAREAPLQLEELQETGQP